MNWLVGTYSKRKSEGIYILDFDEDREKFKLVNSFPEISPLNPSFLAIDSGYKNVYAVGESSSSDPGLIVSYNLINNNQLEKINQEFSFGDNPCHVAVNSKNDFLVVVNYSSGDFSTYKLENGKISFIEKISHEGSSLNKIRQNEPHAHSINFLDDQNFYVCDLGIDEIIRYSINKNNYKIISSKSYKTDPGSGPRHFVIDKKNRRAYSINELDSTINLFEIHSNFDLISNQIISTIPKNYDLETTTADIHFSKDKNYLYGSNRGHDSISKFIISDNGNLVFDKHFSTKGKTPRNFSISNSGKYCLVANENSDDIFMFRIDEHGDLIPTGEKISIPAPVSLLEIIE